MKLLDKLVHALKSAVNDVVSEDPLPADKQDSTLRLIEKAEARLDILKADIERADKRGQTELAARLRADAESLQATLNKTRQRVGATERRADAVTSVERAQDTRKTQRTDIRQAVDTLKQKEEEVAQREDKAAAKDTLDNSRISDLL